MRADPERTLGGRSGSDRLVPLVGAGLLALVLGGLLLGGGFEPDIAEPGPVTVQVGAPRPSGGGDDLSRLRTGDDPLGPKLASGLRLQPRANGSHGLLIVGTADPALLDASGLRIGDVVLESDGTPLGVDGARVIAEQMTSLDALEVTIERDGRQRRLTLLLRSER